MSDHGAPDLQASLFLASVSEATQSGEGGPPRHLIQCVEVLRLLPERDLERLLVGRRLCLLGVAEDGPETVLSLPPGLYTLIVLPEDLRECPDAVARAIVARAFAHIALRCDTGPPTTESDADDQVRAWGMAAELSALEAWQARLVRRPGASSRKRRNRDASRRAA